MINYTICNQADKIIFHKQCAAIEKYISPIEKAALLTDVDGSLIQKYVHEGIHITVFNDMNIDAVYVKSDKDIKHFFNRD